jgi:DNA-binding beta-propeller fold protein YncE
MYTEGIAIDGDGTIIKVEDDPARIVWMRDDGTVLREIDGHSLDPMLTEPQGIARDPRNGHLLIVDDWEGSNSLFELDAAGRLLATHPLIAWGRDPEGIAIRPGTNMLFMAFDGGARIAAFDYVPTVVGAGAPPEPGADCAISALQSPARPV